MQEIRIGDRVQYRSYVRPNPILTGQVIDILPDLDKRKKHKFLIKPDSPVGKYLGNIVRWMPNEGLDAKGNMIEPMLEDVIGVIQTTQDDF